MKKKIVALALLLLPFAASASSAEVLVLASAPVAMNAGASARAIEIQNLGPNAIYCSVGSAPVVTKSRKIDPGSSWTIESDLLRFAGSVSCIAATADQVTGAATIVTEVP